MEENCLDEHVVRHETDHHRGDRFVGNDQLQVDRYKDDQFRSEQQRSLLQNIHSGCLLSIFEMRRRREEEKYQTFDLASPGRGSPNPLAILG
jgi:hypothetical protein